MRLILVHGAGHGAWCWYKIIAALRSSGYSISAVDLVGCGSDPRRIPEDASTFAEYTQPLMDLVAAAPEDEKLVLVGHSLGGLSLASAMEAFPQKIAVAVFVSAVIPATNRAAWHVFEEHVQSSPDLWKEGLENKTISVSCRSQPLSIFSFRPKFLATNLYQKCAPEDFALASMMVRCGSFFHEDLKNMTFSEERYGSVDKVFIVCGEDAVLTADFQKWMIQNSVVKEVMEIEEADHMAMLSKPQELCQCLVTIVKTYA